ncbi:MAG TPA: hypothetical protein VE093_42260 [Polyangiaceae bacterium]|jgi:hypothetical protein|nr:hypothetical protein [Polyangiaceae bacterium]
MNIPNDDLDERLERLARATEDVRPGRGFEARVKAALRAERERDGDFRDVFVRAARPVLAAAALAATFALGFAAARSSEADTSAAVLYGVEEVDW